jgi:hypothetical protein
VQSHTDVQARLNRRQRMEPESYNGYTIWGHAISQQDGYAASGTITRGTKLVEGSGVLATCTTEEEARLIGLDWARAWVDTHG